MKKAISKIFQAVTNTYVRIIFFWFFVLGVLFEFVFLRICLDDLPLKYGIHLSGPIQRLSQYSKKSLLPKEYIAIVGDSYAYGFGPWLYDNSWSWNQPDYASQHIIHAKTGIDVISFGYPGYGNFGSALTLVSEFKFLNASSLWPTIEKPSLILFYFYEGNDLYNNLLELQQRGLEYSDLKDNALEARISEALAKEASRFDGQSQWHQQLATYNLLGGLTNKFLTKLKTQETKVNDLLTRKEDIPEPESSSAKPISIRENIMLLSGIDHNFGFAEGPALHLSDIETSGALSIFKKSLDHLTSNFPHSKIAVVYIPSALSTYRFISTCIRPAPLELYAEKRNRVYEPAEAWQKCNLIRMQIRDILKTSRVELIDPTEPLRKEAQSTLMHGPRDPIHFNEKGYLAFSEIIYPEVMEIYQQASKSPRN